MSGRAVSRLFLAVGWLGLVLSLALFSVRVAGVIGSLLLLIYGIFFVDATRPAPERKSKSTPRDPTTLERAPTRYAKIRG